MVYTIAEAANIARKTLLEEAQMEEVLRYIEEMNEMEFREEMVNHVIVIDEETGEEVYFDPTRMCFCKVLDSTLYTDIINLEMDEVLRYIENEEYMNEIEFEEELVNEDIVIDEETGKEVYFNPYQMCFREELDSTLYVTNTDMDKRYNEMFPKLC